MDDPFLVSVVNGATNFGKDLQAMVDAQFLVVTVLVEWNTTYVLHNEVRQTVFSRSAVQDSSDIGVVHHGQRFAFRLEPSHELFLALNRKLAIGLD